MRPSWCSGFAALLITAACSGRDQASEPPPVFDPTLSVQETGTDALLISVAAIDRDTVWASGTGGTWIRTTDGGATWRTGVVPGADSLQFRDVHALNGSTAWLLSIGNGDQSRIYRTDDGGVSWRLQFRNPEPDAFFDCLDFWDGEAGIAFSDSFEGSFYITETRDGGTTWTRIPPDRLPPAADGEGSFASSGTCLLTGPDGVAWIGTGASPAGPRVLRTTDRGSTWTAVPAPIVAGPAAGIATLSFHDGQLGAAIGGDIGNPDSITNNVAITTDGGLTWIAAAHTPFPGAAYGSSWVPGATDPILVAVGPGGIAFTLDRASTWTVLDTLTHWGVDFVAPDAGWAVGPDGRVTRIQLFRGEQ